MDMSDNSTLLPTPIYKLVIWGVIDSILILLMLGGNILTICAVKFSRKLSAVLSNQFVFSLALSDIMVAISFPYHYAFLIDCTLNTTRELCILRFSFTILACSSSVSNLLGIAIDRYIAILYPLHYTRYMTKRAAVIAIISIWVAALGISSIPIFWNVWKEGQKCSLHTVLAPEYTNFLLTPFFASIWVIMLIVYIRIWREANSHTKRLRNTSYNHGKNFNDSKSVQVVLLILGCVSICWLPFFLIIIVMKVESSTTYEITLHMAIANSCMNPIIYAWKNSNFRKIFWCLLRCKKPNSLNYTSSYITNYIPKKADDSNKSEDSNNKLYIIKQHNKDKEYTDNLKNNYKSGSNGSVETESTSVNSLPQII